MSIISDICMTIDVVNGEIAKDDKLFHTFRAIKNRNRLSRIIDHALSIGHLKIDMVIDFLNFYKHSVDNIKYEELEIKESEDNKIINAYIYNTSKDLTIQFIYNYSTEKTELKFLDKNNNFRTNIAYELRYAGKDTNLKKYVEIANTSFKILITKYLYARLHIGR